MKLRNRLIALVCLLLFLGVGAALFLTTTARKPFAIILFLGDNLNPSTLTATRLFAGGADARLQLEDLPNAALCRNAARDFSVPENASASTALAAGTRVNRGSLCIDAGGLKLPSLLEDAALHGRGTGLITAGAITGTTAAAYYAKTINAEDHSDFASQFFNHTPFDYVVGEGTALEPAPVSASATNTNAPAKATTPDKENSPLDQYAKNGVVVLRSVAELENQPFWKTAPILGLLPPSQLSLTHPGEGNPEIPSLSDLVRLAITHLQANRRGYLLVVDDPSIGEAATANDAESMFKRILAFDQAVATARRYAGENALVVVAGRQNIGGLQLNGYPFSGDKGVAILSMSAPGTPSLCWATGPGFAPESKPDTAAAITNSPNTISTNSSKKPAPGILSQPSAYSLPQGIGVAGDVLTLGAGQGSEKLRGFLDLTEIHQLIFDEL